MFEKRVITEEAFGTQRIFPWSDLFIFISLASLLFTVKPNPFLPHPVLL